MAKATSPTSIFLGIDSTMANLANTDLMIILGPEFLQLGS